MRGGSTPMAGFSLIELMIVLAIIGLFILLALPSFSTWIMNTQIRNTAESIVNGLQLARNEALRRNAAVRFELAATGSDWQVSCIAIAPACPNTDPIQSRATGEGANTTITVAGPKTFDFGGLGTLTSPAGGASLDIDGPNPAESRELRVTISPGGNVRMCDPQTIAPDPRACS